MSILSKYKNMDTNLHKTIKIGGAGNNIYVVVENGATAGYE